MRSRVVVAVAVVAGACGRLDFAAVMDGSRSGGSGDAPAPSEDAHVPAALVAANTQSSINVNPYHMPVQAVTAGDLLIIGATFHSTQSIVSVDDNLGHQFSSANARASLMTTSTEIWYLPDAVSTTTVNIDINGAGAYDAWIIELAHAQTLDQTMTATSDDPPGLASASVTTTTPDELVIGFTVLSNSDNLTTVMAPFVGFQLLNGDGGAYYVAPTPSTYGPNWNRSNSGAATTAASTASFY